MSRDWGSHPPLTDLSVICGQSSACAARLMRWLVLLICLGVAAPVLAMDIKQAHVLYINSYHRGYVWSDGIEQGLRQRLLSSGKEIELSVEYLDTRRFPLASHLGFLAEEIAIKYAKYPPTVLVVSDNDAFDFAMKYRERLFPGVPMVFCAYNDFRPERILGKKNITGVNEAVSFLDTIEVALKLHPDTRTLVFIGSTEEATGLRNFEELERTVFPRFKGQYALLVLNNHAVTEIGRRLKELSGKAVVFIIGQTRDRLTGRVLTGEEAGQILSAAIPFPIYSFWEFYLNTGVVGGQVLSGADQGRSAADLTLQILNGMPAHNLPVIMSTPARNMFDYRAMQRFGISPDALPEDSVILNRPFSLWLTYRWQILGIACLLILETLLVIVLIHLSRDRRKALHALALERTLLEKHVETRTVELKAANERLALLSFSDSLTQLANRRCFDKVLSAELLRHSRNRSPLSLIMLDIDFFKNFNDTYGHVAGDACLRKIGALLELMANRAADLAARYGGEEFAVILPDTDAHGALNLALRIREEVAALAIEHASSSIARHVTASLGVVTINTANPMPLVDVVELADQQLYQAKAKGRNQVVAADLS